MRVKDIILVVENERSTKNLIVTLLTANGYSPLVASSEEKTRSLMYSRCPDLVILDLDIPDMDGIETLKELRTWSNMPVIIISKRKDEKSKVAVLDMGADDYLEKPFGNGELLARIRTALRHARMSDNDEIERLGKIEIDGLIIDYDTHTVTMKGIEVHMTPHEYKVIALLAMHTIFALRSTADAISKESNLEVQYFEIEQGDIGRVGLQLAYNEYDLVLFFNDPDDANYSLETSLIARSCDCNNIPFATNSATAEALLLALARGNLDWREMPE